MTGAAALPDRNQLLSAIRGVGHWRVRILPESTDQRFTRPRDCGNAVAASAVRLRGWDYPHVPIKNDELRRTTPVPDGWEAMVDWDRHREFWRLMRSGQFIHYLALWEDIAPETRDQRILGVSGVIYSLLEFVEFSRRLTEKAAYGTSIQLEINLIDVRDRKLTMLDPMRMIDREYTTAESVLELRRTLPVPLVEAGARSAARELAVELFDIFQLNVQPRIVEDIQEELLERR